jgi:hypothetical protein
MNAWHVCSVVKFLPKDDDDGVIEEHYVSESAMQIVTVYIYVRVIIVRITTIIIILWHIFYAPSAKIGFFLDRCSIYTIRI